MRSQLNLLDTAFESSYVHVSVLVFFFTLCTYIMAKISVPTKLRAGGSPENRAGSALTLNCLFAVVTQLSGDYEIVLYLFFAAVSAVD